MKRKLLNTTAIICFLGVLIGCTEDAATDSINDNATEFNTNNAAAYEKSSRPDYWDGVIGEEVGGDYIITVDEELIKKDFEDALMRANKTTTIENVAIVAKTASNDDNDKAHFLIGTDNKGLTIGLMLSKTGSSFILFKDNGFVKTVTCEGCISGCNLQYLTVNGQRVAYCNENGCVYNCSKTESEFN